MKNLKGFTLAEVLITLGIIGVVSAMTIPALINNVRAVKLRSQFNKAYSEVQQAFKLMADNESVAPSDYYRTASFYKHFIKYFKSGFDCGTNGTNMNSNLPCYSRNLPPYKTLHGGSTNGQSFDDGQIGLMDGSLLLMENISNRLWISIDINGYNNPPNQWGIDLFTFEVTDDGLIPMGNAKSSYKDADKFCDPTKSVSNNGITCAEKAVKDPNYFKDLYKNYRK